MSFEIGQRVICVNDKPAPGLKLGGLRRGAVYTIREVGIPSWRYPDKMAVRVVEIVRPAAPHSPADRPYLEDRFEALPRKTTNIEVFRKMLLPCEQHETV